MNDFYEKFRVKDLLIYKTKYWTWSLRPKQITLASSVLSLNRQAATFSKVSAEEFQDLKNIVGIIEKGIKKAFGYDIMNYLMLMMVDHQVHYHVIPRYSKKVVFNTENWEDESWPKPPNVLKALNHKTGLTTIINELRKYI